MKWKITYYNTNLEEEIFSLPDTLLARYLKLADLIEKYGADLGMPHTKALGKSLFELRVKGKEAIARIFYCTMIEKRIHMLHCFIKKSQKIPDKELSIARKRLKEVKGND
jgi:phage-related protein